MGTDTMPATEMTPAARPSMTDIRPGRTLALSGQTVEVMTEMVWVNRRFEVAVRFVATGEYYPHAVVTELTF